jgi:hypothetical protein
MRPVEALTSAFDPSEFSLSKDALDYAAFSDYVDILSHVRSRGEIDLNGRSSYDFHLGSRLLVQQRPEPRDTFLG